ncbi:MAG: hypothetical protein ABIC82_00730 [bacterium]
MNDGKERGKMKEDNDNLDLEDLDEFLEEISLKSSEEILERIKKVLSSKEDSTAKYLFISVANDELLSRLFPPPSIKEEEIKQKLKEELDIRWCPYLNRDGDSMTWDLFCRKCLRKTCDRQKRGR